MAFKIDRYTMLPWDNSTEGLIKSNKTRNPFGEMIGQLIRQVNLTLDFNIIGT